MKKLLSLTLAAALLLLPATGCKPKDDKKAKDTVTIVTTVKSEVLYPLSTTSTDKVLMHALYDNLVEFSPEGEIVPALAESWTISDDGLDFTFSLRKDVTYHDGTPFVADDIVFFIDERVQIPSGMFLLQYKIGRASCRERVLRLV